MLLQQKKNIIKICWKYSDKSGAKYVEYVTQKIANEKAQHAKDMQIKEVQF